MKRSREMDLFKLKVMLGQKIELLFYQGCKLLRWVTQGQGENSVYGNVKSVAKNYWCC